MPVFYQDALFRVEQGFLTSWRVTYLPSGLKVKPEADLQEKMGFVWHLVRKTHGETTTIVRLAEDVLMQVFAMAALEPNGEAANLFRALGKDDLARNMVAEAKARLAGVGRI